MSIFKDKKELFESFYESVLSDENAGVSANVTSSGAPAGSIRPIVNKDVSELLLNDLETKMLEILQESKLQWRFAGGVKMYSGCLLSRLRHPFFRKSVSWTLNCAKGLYQLDQAAPAPP